MYLDTDVVLALVKEEDWLKSAVDPDALREPKTSVVTVIEIQLVYFEERGRDFLSAVPDLVRDEGVEILGLSPDVIDASSRLLGAYKRLNVFDSVHLGHASLLEEPIVSTDTLYPDIEEVQHLDPREL